jgi:LuxR family transcriptional regulator, maltose regulon positive regulatory protein
VRLRLAEHDRAMAAEPGRGGEAASLQEVLQALQRMHADAPSARGGTLLEVGMLQALTLQALGDLDAAVVVLDRALEEAPEPESYVRLFLDEGAPMVGLLRRAASSSGDLAPHAAAHAQRLLSAATHDGKGTRDVREPGVDTGGALVEPLSDRELDVLRLLDSELTGPEIAKQLYVSLNTLRTHTKRIFTKLDVRSRAAAVRRGRQLGLL